MNMTLEKPVAADESPIIGSIVPHGFLLMLSGSKMGSIKFHLRSFETLEAAIECADFFSEHWHDKQARFEVWRDGQLLHTAPPEKA